MHQRKRKKNPCGTSQKNFPKLKQGHKHNLAPPLEAAGVINFSNKSVTCSAKTGECFHFDILSIQEYEA